MTRLKPYGSDEQAHNLSKVGKGKTPARLAANMPSPELIAKAGVAMDYRSDGTRRVVRRNPQG